MDKHIIGENAGVLWRFLNTDAQKKWQLEEIKKAPDWTIWNWRVPSVGWRERTKSSLNFNIRMGKKKKHMYILC